MEKAEKEFKLATQKKEEAEIQKILKDIAEITSKINKHKRSLLINTTTGQNRNQKELVQLEKDRNELINELKTLTSVSSKA
jgi:histidinol phosphatase-like PHP family hydrolase